MMELRYAANPNDVKKYDTARLRADFLVRDLFQPGGTKLVYSHVDRIIFGGVCPLLQPVALEAGAAIRAQYFLERREMGVINIGGRGTVTVDGVAYELNYKDGLYIGMGSQAIDFASADRENPAKFYLNSAPAHQTYPTVLIKPENCTRVELGSLEASNHRVITKYISCRGRSKAVSW
jgi:4-deoxy-L-threo-5-hexosulose-uronate ketol-isomerase